MGVDIFELNGKEYLTTVDYYSNFWEIDKLPTDAKATTVIAKLKGHLARYGIPDQVATDNGPSLSHNNLPILQQHMSLNTHPPVLTTAKETGKWSLQ